MPTPTPGIKLTFDLLNMSGVKLGTAQQPAWLRIALCAFGANLPRVPNAGVIGQVSTWFVDIPYYGTSGSVILWGNDVIDPGPDQTYYAISVLDTQKNIVQTALYQFDGTGTYDLSTAVPFTPGYNTPSGYIIVNPAAGSFSVNPHGWNGPVTIDMNLTANASLTLGGFQRGQLVQFLIRQNSTGGWTFTWPANVKNAPAVDTDANSVTTANYFVDQFGNFYPQLGWS